MKKKAQFEEGTVLRGRVLARVLADDLHKVAAGGIKSTSCGSGCDEFVNDSWKLQDDQY
ncbi:MAG TPA: hypothetical protein VH988_29495 [Thermoanaerobaculia bacterium]|jgi:hypothetical protein|nr:hypothetical protein [Thermoanaerobaculia bacterium]